MPAYTPPAATPQDILDTLEEAVAAGPVELMVPSESGIFQDVDIASPKRKRWFGARRGTTTAQPDGAYPAVAEDATREGGESASDGGTTGNWGLLDQRASMR